jgi:hypothetical protein
MKFVFVLVCIASSLSDLSGQSSDTLNWDAYMEWYVGWDDLRNKEHQRPDFLYNHSRSEEFALNLALVQANHGDSTYQIKGGFMVGNYASRNLSAEPAGFRSIYAAAVSIRLQAKHDIWLESGVFPSHIGFESAIGMDNPNLTRSLIAENSPYYESGVKMTGLSVSKKWKYLLALLNGWQRIAVPSGYFLPAIGGQITYQPNAKWIVNYSNFVGDQDGSRDVELRHFHNFYLVYRTIKELQLTWCGDIGFQPDLQVDERPISHWYGWAFMAQLPLCDRMNINGRIEQYVDDHELVVNNPYSNAFHLKGYSVGFDYRFGKGFCLRSEFKRLYGQRYHFIQNQTQLTNVSHMMHVSLCWKKPK